MLKRIATISTIIPIIFFMGLFSANWYLDGQFWWHDFFWTIDEWKIRLKEAKIEQSFDIWNAQAAWELNALAKTDNLKGVFRATWTTVEDIIIANNDKASPVKRLQAVHRLLWGPDKIHSIQLENSVNIIEKYYETKVKDAVESIEVFEEFNRVWIYSDWSLENSEFDIIVDLDDINKIIFWLWESNYWWPNWSNSLWGFSDDIRELVNKTYDSPPNFSTVRSSSLTNKPKSWPSTWNVTPVEVEDLWKPRVSENKNSVEIDLDWLTCSPALDFWIEKTDETIPWIPWDNWENWNDSGAGNGNGSWESDLSYTDQLWETVSDLYDAIWDTYTWWNWYKPTVDNFWCRPWRPFCIIIEMITYESFYEPWDTSSIDYIISKSNSYLEYWAMSSKVQYDMATANWELPFDDLNLLDTFSSGVIIFKKPIPMLQTDSEREHTQPLDEFESEKMLEKSFESIWLEYKKANDLTKYIWLEKSKFIASNNKDWDTGKITKDLAELAQKEKAKEAKIKTLNNNIKEAIGSNSDYLEFANQFQEISTFMKQIEDYSINLEEYIKIMEDIPSK